MKWRRSSESCDTKRSEGFALTKNATFLNRDLESARPIARLRTVELLGKERPLVSGTRNSETKKPRNPETPKPRNPETKKH